jgi:hypothetical protein
MTNEDTTMMELDGPQSSQDPTSSRKALSSEELVRQVLRMADHRSRAELIVLELMDEFSFSFEDFKELLRGKLSIHI